MRTILFGSLAAGLIALAAQKGVADDLYRLNGAAADGSSTLRLDGTGDDADNVLVYRRGGWGGGWGGGYRGGYWGGGYRGYYGGYRGYYGGYRGYGYYGGYRPFYGYGYSNYGYSYPYYGGSYYYSPYSYSYYGCSADLASMPAATPLGMTTTTTQGQATYRYNGNPQVVPQTAPRTQPVSPQDGLLVSNKNDARYQFRAYGEEQTQAPARAPATSGAFLLVSAPATDTVRVSLPTATTGGVIGRIER